MKILFKNVTEYTKENCDDFLRFHTNKFAKTELIKMAILAIGILYVLIYSIIYRNWILVLIILAMCAMTFLYYKKEPIKEEEKPYNIDSNKNIADNNKIEDNKLVPLKSNKSFLGKIIVNRKSTKKKKRNPREYTFYFYEKYMKIRNGKKFKRVRYYKFKKVFETDEYFFIYVDDREPWMLKKDGFEIGNPKRFSNFIKGKCIFRYKNEQ